MVDEPHGKTQWMSTWQDTTAERGSWTRLEQETFLAQLANALTALNGWVYLAQMSPCRTHQQRYLDAIQDTVQHITRLMQYHGQTR